MWRVLLVYMTPHPRAVRLTIRQHIRALERIPNADWVLPYNAVRGVPQWLGKLDFDAVVLHTTFLCMRWGPWFEQWKTRSAWLSDLDCVKIALPQDEYHHAETLDSWLNDLGVTVVGTVLDSTHRGDLYPRLSNQATFYELLTGYIDDEAAERVRPHIRPPEQRNIDVVYRARNLPYWLGSHGQLKHRIGEAVAARGPAHGLSCDISTRPHQTILGDAWLEFMATGRATIGAESGSSSLDRRGELPKLYEERLAAEPDMTFEKFASRMPHGWDDYRFFALSPRHLEAVITKTAQILVEGCYSGVLEPGRHYIPVRRDLSDLDDALEAANDHSLLEQLAEQAFRDVHQSGRYSYVRLTEKLERMIREHVSPRKKRPLPARRLVETAATAEAGIQRIAAAPIANVLWVGRDGYGEMFAGLRLLVTDASARRLMYDYARSTETRSHVSPRVALADLVVLGAVRRISKGKVDGVADFGVRADVDTETRRLVIRSHTGTRPERGGDPPSAHQLASLLEERGWEFSIDHSEVGASIAYPLIGSRSHDVPVPGRSSLRLLNWLARSRPRDVAAALSPVLERH